MMKLQNKIEFDEQGFATEDGFLSAFIVNQESMEYIGIDNIWVSQGTGLPYGAYLDEPPTRVPVGNAVVRTEQNGWQFVEDHRGVIVYDTITKQPSEIKDLGPIPAGKTTLPPSSQFDHWSGEAWERDEAAEQQAKLEASQAEQAMRISEANQQIAILAPAVEGGYAKQEHVQLLADWRRYRYDVVLVPEQPDWPEKPLWPEKPQSAV